MAATKTRVKIRPIGDKVVVKRIEADDMTAGGMGMSPSGYNRFPTIVCIQVVPAL